MAGGRASAIAAGLGLLFAVWLYGWRVIDPASSAWLMHGDPAQHYLGSVFFLGEPWHWPPGGIHRFGEVPTSIVFTDAIPLLALAVKAISLPPGTQYFGLWMLACHALAGFFGVRLLRRLGLLGGAATWIGALFFITAPALLLRAYGHEALMGHFIVLWALGLALSPWCWRSWLLCVGVAVLVHPYLALMAAVIGTGTALAAWIDGRIDPLRLLAQAFGAAAAVGGAAWGAGYFVGSGAVSAEGHGFFSANLLTWFDPMDWGAFTRTHQRAVPYDREWSRFLPALRQATGGQYEGFAYLGLGMLLVLAGALLLAVGRLGGRSVGPESVHGVVVERPSRWQSRLLWGSVTLLALMAWSLRPSIGGLVLADLEAPEPLGQVLGVFRAGGRFVWPLTYLVMAVAIARVASRSRGSLLLAVAFAVQWADLHGKFHEFRTRFRDGPPGIARPVADPSWAHILSRCRRLELVSLEQPPAGWESPALAAGLAGASVTPAPTARRTPQAQTAQRAAVQALIESGGWRGDTVYLLADPMPGTRAALVADRLPPTHRSLAADGHLLAVPQTCLSP